MDVITLTKEMLLAVNIILQKTITGIIIIKSVSISTVLIINNACLHLLQRDGGQLPLDFRNKHNYHDLLVSSNVNEKITES